MDQFLKACGATGPLQLIVEHRGMTAMRWSAPQPFALIGRDPAADLSLDHPRVDWHHAYLQVIAGKVYCVDLGSQTGTRWESGPAHSGWLGSPAGIGIGPYVIQFAPDDRAITDSAAWWADRLDPLSSRSRESDDLPRVILEFRRDSAKPVRWRMRHVLTLVGTSPQCKVRLSAPGVSPFHCSLLRTAAGVWAVNLVGPGGLTLNRVNIRAARLNEGDELRIGDILVRVFYESSMAAEGEVGLAAGDDLGHSTLLTHPIVASRELAPNRPETGWAPASRDARRLLTERVSSEDELPASLLALVLDQFGQMQQQFLNQFQQTTLMMFRALGTMHRDQMEELREKLESLHQLGENLQALEARLSATVAPVPGPHAPEGVSSPPPRPALIDASGEDPRGNGQDHSSTAATSHQARSAAENGAEQLRAKVRSLIDQPNIPSPNVHEWLIGRIAELEDEQRTRWQKLLDLVRRR